MKCQILDYSKKWSIKTIIRETDKLLSRVGLKPKYKIRNKCHLCGKKIEVIEGHNGYIDGLASIPFSSLHEMSRPNL